jgi:hypothetical protein
MAKQARVFVLNVFQPCLMLASKAGVKYPPLLYGRLERHAMDKCSSVLCLFVNEEERRLIRWTPVPNVIILVMAVIYAQAQ